MKANRKLMFKNDDAQVGIGTLIIFIAMVLVAAVAAAVLIQTSGVLQQKAQQTGKESTKEVSSNVGIDSIEGWRAGTNQSAADIDTMSDSIYRLDIRASLKVGSEPVDMNQVVITITDGTNTNDLRYINGVINTTGTTTGTSLLNTTAGYPGTYYRLEVTKGSTDDLQYFKSAYPDAHESGNVTYGVSGTATKDRIGNNSSNTYFARADKFYMAEEIRDEDKSYTKANPVMNKGDLVKISIFTAPDTADTNIGFTALANNETMGESSLSITTRSTISINIVPEGGANTQVDFVAPSSFGTKQSVGMYP